MSDQTDRTDPDDLEAFEALPVSIQQAIARGDVTLAELEERIRASEGAELCPRCASRPVTERSVGLCRVCYLKALAAAQREHQAEVLAKREAAAQRKRSQRVREAAGVPAGLYSVRKIGYSAAWGVRRDGSPTIGGHDRDAEDESTCDD